MRRHIRHFGERFREELGVEITVDDWLGQGRATDGDATIELEIYTARIVRGEILLTEHCRYGWFRAEQVDALDWAAADRPVLATLKRLLARRQHEISIDRMRPKP